MTNIYLGTITYLENTLYRNYIYINKLTIFSCVKIK